MEFSQSQGSLSGHYPHVHLIYPLTPSLPPSQQELEVVKEELVEPQPTMHAPLEAAPDGKAFGH